MYVPVLRLLSITLYVSGSRLEKCGDFLNKVEDIATNGAPLSPAPTFSLPLPTPSTLTARDPPFPSPKPRDVPALEIVLDVDKERTMKEMCWDDSQKGEKPGTLHCCWSTFSHCCVLSQSLLATSCRSARRCCKGKCPPSRSCAALVTDW